MQAEDQEIMEFVVRVDDLGPFSPLSVLHSLLESVPTGSEIRKTPLYHYLSGVHDARSFWDKTDRNDL
jgi:hypothetical protein